MKNSLKSENKMKPLDLILERFEQISAVPRGSYNEAGLRAWLQNWADQHAFLHQADAAGNLVIRVPATPGFENHPALILQGHMDMVCEKTPDSPHDFTHDPIRLIREGDWIHADHTTLGADNGIGVALMLALVESDEIEHPALELLLTVAEETGLVGASALDPALVTAKTLINLDSEKVGEFTIGCAGGGTVNISLPVAWSAVSSAETAFELSINGLLGGHSGEDINSHRTNANKLLGRFLEAIQRKADIRLAVLKGGSARNAIPRSAVAVFVCPQNQADLCKDVFATLLADVSAEQLTFEPAMTITLGQPETLPQRALGRAETAAGIRLLVSLPDGVAAMSADMPGFVETSNNIGVIELTEQSLEISSSQRSAVLSRLLELIERVEALAWLAGAKTERVSMYAPWQPNMASHLLKKTVEVYQNVSGQKPEVMMTHGGLECGIISERCGGLDSISMGPALENLHSPDERLFVPSLEPTWEFLKVLLKSLA